ncbi:MAG: hypothetical protein ACUVTW_06660 [Thermogutta sp.]
MQELLDLIGLESDLCSATTALCRAVERERPTVVGALHVTCSDEAEWETAAVFQRDFVERLLPSLKLGQKAAFRSVNLGSRYESGACRVMVHHFALAEPKHIELDLLHTYVVKINSHVGILETADGPVFGQFLRFGHPSACCGALAAAIAGNRSFTSFPDTPAFADIAESLADIPDHAAAYVRQNVAESLRMLYFAVLHAQRQALAATRELERAVAELKDARVSCYVVAGVAVNRPGPDSEIVVSVTRFDKPPGGLPSQPEMRGLGLDPRRYHATFDRSRLRITG